MLQSNNMKKFILIALLLVACNSEKRVATICTCAQLEKVAEFITANTKASNNMSDEEMEDVIIELRNTGIKLHCTQRVMYFPVDSTQPDWEIEKLDSCESYHYTLLN